ncbi:tetratricopeptide repeat protein [Paludisphaera rhizosphaerae]|uniref:tetratricopeptide repeat protein n=1 Tax=Paludisphaera rhizosphaerae TaxID=2711216 RepID=UPI0013EA84D0|nr:tetratricopeptide repeat protein [Paludisphaera rhizosphaerae]
MTVKKLLIAACALLAWRGDVASRASDNDLRVEGAALAQAGRYAEALQRFDAVLSHHPRDIQTLARRGNVHLMMGRPSKGLEDFDRAIQAQPLYVSAWSDRGVALVMLGRLSEAEASFTRAIRASQAPAPSLINMADGGALGGGGPSFDVRSPEAKRERATPHAGLGQVYYRLNRNAEAIDEYNEAIRLYPSDPNSYIGRSDVRRVMGDNNGALADLDEAVRLGPNYARAHANRGRLLEDMKQNEQAEAAYTQAIAVDPNDVFGYRLRGALRSKLGRNTAALADFESVANLRPDDSENLKDRGGVLVRMGRNEEALVTLDRAIEIDPNNAKAYQNRGAAYNNLGRYVAAVADLDRAIKLDPQNAGARTNCGLALFMLGEYERSMEDLGEAVKLAPNNAIVHFNRGNVYAKLGFTELALADYQAVEKADPRLLASYGGPAKVLAEMTRERMAVRTPAPRPEPDSEAELALKEGRSLQAAGDWPAAVAAFDRAVAADPQRAESYIARGWTRLCADVDGAETDARAFLNLKGWSDPASAYMAILGALAERRVGRDPAAYAFLEEARAKLPPNSAWPRPLLLHLDGDLAEPALLEAAANDLQRAEAHTILAVGLLRRGKTAEAREHLGWVRDHPVAGSVAADLARATLVRLDQAEQVARKP